MLSNAIRLDKRAAYVVDCAAVQSMVGPFVFEIFLLALPVRFIFIFAFRKVLRFSYIPELDEARINER